jgi:hypothetical protein
LLNAGHPFGHLCFSSQILAFQSLPRSTDWAAVGSGSPVLGAGRDNPGDSSHKRLIVLASPCNHQIQYEFDEDAMLDLANDIRSLSEFKRNTVDLLDRLRRPGTPWS